MVQAGRKKNIFNSMTKISNYLMIYHSSEMVKLMESLSLLSTLLESKVMILHEVFQSNHYVIDKFHKDKHNSLVIL